MNSSIFTKSITKILQENSKKPQQPVVDTSSVQFSDSMTDEDINKYIQKVARKK